ncbi:MAG TPA: phytoene/squalene synthase family protein [Pyrinomonadaceae bacterium]|nr:phytoene/squalene synthase family protein [Pyrinomonadaceae bacterium]
MSSEIENAYRYCESVTKIHAKSFYFAAKFLPKSKQKPIYALYALCRHVDDEVDEAEVHSEAEAFAAVERWKRKLEDIYNYELQIANYELAKKICEDQRPKTKDQNLVLLAWNDLLKTYKIPQNLPLELMTGVLQDTHTKRYETFDELYVYCFRVASTVGLMSSEIFGYSDEKTLEYAEALGIAMQLTNILRDVKEDAAMDRIYLPQEDLRKFNVSKEQIFAGEMNKNFVELINFQIKRARDYYRKAEKGIALLEKDTRFTVLLASRLYSKILGEIEKQNCNVFSKRAHINFRQKVFSIPNIWYQARSL